MEGVESNCNNIANMICQLPSDMSKSDSTKPTEQSVPNITYHLPLDTIIQKALKDPKVWSMFCDDKISLDHFKWRIHDFCYIEIKRGEEVVKLHARNKNLFKQPTKKLKPKLEMTKIKFRQAISYEGAAQLEIKNDKKTTHASNMKLLECLTNRLAPLFHVNNFELDFKPVSNNVTLVDCFIFNVTKKFKTINFSRARFTSNVKFLEEYKFLQNEVIVENLTLNFPDVGNLPCQYPLKQKNVIINNSNFIDRKCIISMECEYLTIARDFFSNTDLTDILFAWIEGKMRNMKRISVVAYKNDIGFDALSNITFVNSTSEPPEEYSKGEELMKWKTIAVDIKNCNDQIGTVMFGYKKFIFYTNLQRMLPIF